jgi:hypothetical protein
MDHSDNSCVDKMSFDTKKEAENTAVIVEHQRGTKLRVYKCRQCQLWHMASNYGDTDDD